MSAESSKPKLLDQLKILMRTRRYSPRTIDAYEQWVRRFILYHNKKHPIEMGAEEVERFLTYLVTDLNVAPATQNQALSALIFLYRHILERPLPAGMRPVRSQKTPKPPTILTVREVTALLEQLVGEIRLACELLYGAGLRVGECVRLRIKDIDFDYKTITIHNGKGAKDRVVPLPVSLSERLKVHIGNIREQHNRDLNRGFGSAPLPYALNRKLPNAHREFAWQFLFPANTLSVDEQDGVVRRSHVSPSTLQRSVKGAARQVGIDKRVTCHTLRHCFATHLLQNGYDIRTVQELMGHNDVKTTMIYTHVLKRGGLGVQSPLDRIR